MQTISLYEALKRMRVLTEMGVPFSFQFISYNESTKQGGVLKEVTGAQLRQGYRADQSDKHNILIGYVNAHQQNRWFYLPLLTKFNNLKVIP